jgi:DNA transposition AAA+ family ATPase
MKLQEYVKLHVGIAKVYIGQTRRSLNIRYKKHVRNRKYNREHSGYIIHILNYIHRYGKIKDITERIHYAQKLWLMDKKESFYIYMYKKQD